MTNQSQPDLSLGEPPKRLATTMSRLPHSWLWSLLLLQCLICGFSLALFLRPVSTAPAQAGGKGKAAELKATALELEDRSLDGQAAQAWQAYLQIAQDDLNRADILYRIGKLYFQSEEYAKAAAALVRAEQACGDDASLKSRIGPVIIDCLRRLGRYGEVGRELSRRVEIGAEKTGQGRVLATFAGESFTEADLDRMVERNVDEMLGMHQSGGGEAARQQLLKRFGTPQMRQQLLNDMLRRELFSRRARDLKIDQEEPFQQARERMEDNLLASQFLSHELKSIQPTNVDINAYFQSNKKQYEQPEQMSIILFELPENADVEQLLDQIKSPEDFKKVAAEQMGDRSENQQASATQTLLRSRMHSQLGNTEPLFQLSAGEWTKTPHVKDDEKYLVLVENKTPASIPSLDQVRPQVENDYTTRKRQELTENLYRDLMSRYEVRINPVESSKPDDKQKSDSKSTVDDQEPHP